MARLRLALLDASHSDEHTPRNFRREIDADLVEFDVSGGDLPESLDSEEHSPSGSGTQSPNFDGVVVTGSRASVYWDEPWIPPLKEWVAAAIEHDLPFLGICFGHQLLADVLGGTIENMGEYEIGYREIEHTGESSLFEGIEEQFVSFTTHQDAVVTLPPGAEALARNEYGNHSFRKGRVFGVQFHPEYDMDTARTITRGKDLSDERRQRVLDGINEENFEAACESKVLFDNFCSYVRAVRDAERAPAR